MRDSNSACGSPRPELLADTPRRFRWLEKLLSGKIGDRFERWEMDRKVEKFNRQYHLTAETAFNPDQVQGHFNSYRARTLAEFERRVAEIREQQ